MVVLLIQSGQKWHLHISLEVQWLVAEELGHNSAFVWAVSPPLERLISLQDSFFFAYKMKTVLEEFFSFTKRCWLAGSRSRHLCYCLFHYPHSHQPHPSCPPPSLWALATLHYLLSRAIFQGRMGRGTRLLEWHTTSNGPEHCPERCINLLSYCLSKSRIQLSFSNRSSPDLPPSLNVLHKSACKVISFHTISLMILHSTQLAPIPDFSLRSAVFELGCAAENYNASQGNGHYFNFHL